jgi:hypothetical protein
MSSGASLIPENTKKIGIIIGQFPNSNTYIPKKMHAQAFRDSVAVVFNVIWTNLRGSKVKGMGPFLPFPTIVLPSHFFNKKLHDAKMVEECLREKRKIGWLALWFPNCLLPPSPLPFPYHNGTKIDNNLGRLECKNRIHSTNSRR